MNTNTNATSHTGNRDRLAALCRAEFDELVAEGKINPEDYDILTPDEDWIAVKASLNTKITSGMTEAEMCKVLFVDAVERFCAISDAFKRERQRNPPVTILDIMMSDDPRAMAASLGGNTADVIECLLRQKTPEEWIEEFSGWRSAS